MEKIRPVNDSRERHRSLNIILLATILIVFKSYSVTCRRRVRTRGVVPPIFVGFLRYNQPLVILESNRTKRSLKAHKGN